MRMLGSASARLLTAAGWALLVCSGQVSAADYLLAPTGAAPWPVGRIAPDDLARRVLADGDRVLLHCGERYAPLRLRTQGGGTVRVEPVAACPAAQPPVFDGRRPLAGGRPGTEIAAGNAGRRSFVQAEAVTQVFAGDQPVPRARHPAVGYLVLDARTPANAAALPKDIPLDPAMLAGATLVARTQEWLIEIRQIQADGRSFDTPLTYPLRPKAGVFFTGKAWMLGSGAGWADDRSTKTLTVQAAGTDGLSASVDEPLLQIKGSAGVAVRGVHFFAAGGNAVDIQSAGVVVVSDVVIKFAAGNAIAVAGARLAQVARVVVDASGGDGVFFAEVARAEVRDSTVLGAGLLHGAGPALAAINAHRTDAAVIERNRVARSGYIGIRVGGDALVQGNRIADSCVSLSDCAAIYTWRRGRDDRRAPVRILGNLVLGAAGDTSVKFGVNDYFSGIYLDEWTRRTEVRGNLVAGVAQGIYLHNAFDNVVAGNVVLGARAQAVLELVDAPIRAALGLPAAGTPADATVQPAGQSAEPPNRWQNALLELPAGVTWARIAADDAVALRAANARVLVLDGAVGARAPATGVRRCKDLLPLPTVPQLPAQVLLCDSP